MESKTIEKIGRVSSSSVLKGTGKNWDHWVQILSEAGANHWTHQEIVAFLRKKHKLGPWWQQGVASSYEIHIGRKIEGRNDKGEYSVAGSKTFPCSQRKMWRLLTSPEGMAIWLKPLSEFRIEIGAHFETEGGAYGEVRTMKAGERLRMTWQETHWTKKSVVQIFIHPRPGDRCMVGFMHEQIVDGRLKNPLRDYWKHVLRDLADFLPAPE